MKQQGISVFSFKRKMLGMAFMLCSLIGFSQSITVDFEGRVTHETAILSEVIVQVLQDGKLLTTFKTDNSGNYNVYLPLEGDYVIVISKNNYVQKFYSVSTKGIPADMSNIKFPSITADVDLFKYYEGVDYSLFDEPVNKFFFNQKKGNFDYDKEYLKQKKEAMRLLKIAERKAIQLALQKNQAKQKELYNTTKNQAEADKLAAEKKMLDEKLAKQNLMLKLIEEDKPLLKSSKKESEVNLNILAATPDASEKLIDKKIADLVNNHKDKVSEEQYKGTGVIIIRRVVVREQESWVYEKKIFDWGGISYFRDKQRITASTFNMETASR